jgi:hypothetical protein
VEKLRDWNCFEYELEKAIKEKGREWESEWSVCSVYNNRVNESKGRGRGWNSKRVTELIKKSKIEFYLKLRGKTKMTQQNILWEVLPAEDGDLRARHRIVLQRRHPLVRCCRPQRHRLWHFRMRRAKNLRLKKREKSRFVKQIQMI